jgi:hypothetical protein
VAPRVFDANRAQFLPAREITQLKLSDIDCPFWLAPKPLYVNQIRARLNFGSASIRLHLHGFLMSSAITPRSLPSARPADMNPENVPLRL